MSWRAAFWASPYSGALVAAILKAPRRVGVGDPLEHRQDVLDGVDLHVGDEDEGVFEIGRHLLAVGHHVGADVALVVFEALREDELVFARLALVDGDDAVLADLVHRVGDEMADFLAPGRDGRDRFDVGIRRDVLADLEELGRHRFASLFHAGPNKDGVGAFLDGVNAAMDHALGQDRRGRRPVAGLLVGLVGDFVDELGAHVLDRVLQLDFPGDGNAVLANRGRAVAFVQGDVASLRPKGNLDRVGELVDPSDHLVAGGLPEIDVLSHVQLASFLDSI